MASRIQQLQQTNAIHELDHHSRCREKEKTGNCFYKKAHQGSQEKRKKKLTKRKTMQPLGNLHHGLYI